jgi:hypothetical protein
MREQPWVQGLGITACLFLLECYKVFTCMDSPLRAPEGLGAAGTVTAASWSSFALQVLSLLLPCVHGTDGRTDRTRLDLYFGM